MWIDVAQRFICEESAYLFYFVINFFLNFIYWDTLPANSLRHFTLTQEIYRRRGDLKNASSTQNKNIFLAQFPTEIFTDVISWHTWPGLRTGATSDCSRI
jgi:hypothetical protein